MSNVLRDETNGITVRPPAAGKISLPADVPEHIRAMAETGTDTGTELLAGYVRPPRLKVVQKSSGGVYAEKFKVGQVIIVGLPEGPVALTDIQMKPNGRPEQFGESFYFVPLFFYPEWCLVNPLETRGTLPMIRERTLDPRSAIAARCQDQRKWFQPCPELMEKNMRYQEHLNFVIRLVGRGEDDDLARLNLMMTFARGSHGCGTNLAGLIRMKGRVKICSHQFEARASWTEREKGDYYRIEPQNPREGSVDAWVKDPALFEEYVEQHEAMKAAYHDRRLIADIDDDQVVEGEYTQTGSSPQY